jgi:hypothetical protein
LRTATATTSQSAWQKSTSEASNWRSASSITSIIPIVSPRVTSGSMSSVFRPRDSRSARSAGSSFSFETRI